VQQLQVFFEERKVVSSSVSFAVLTVTIRIVVESPLTCMSHLFIKVGDTVNTAARMESNGEKNKIHVSESTAHSLITLGKGHWVTPRKDKVYAKGKGELQTYFVEPKSGAASVSVSSEPSSTEGSVEHEDLDDKTTRLSKLIRQIVACRLSCSDRVENESVVWEKGLCKSVIDEVTEVIELPAFSSKKKMTEVALTELSPNVQEQLREYIEEIASMYDDNAFHNFEHVSTMENDV
jgi:Adenylate and Guanylate cyclase catalytic domain